MRLIERSGIHLERCPECRGIFLDRGELDRLLDLESASIVSDAGSRPGGRDDRRSDPSYRDREFDDDLADGRGPGGRRRGGFLNQLFENFGD